MDYGTSRTRIIEASTQLFREKGYHATSIADILARAGAQSGSLYHYFPTKWDLLKCVLERYLANIEADLLAPAWSATSDPIGRIFALFEHYRALLVASGGRYRCPIGSLALELCGTDGDMRQRLAAIFSAWTDAIAGCLEEARARFAPHTDFSALAEFALVTLQGGLMQARTHADPTHYDRAVRQFAMVLSIHHLEKADETLTVRCNPRAPGAPGAGGGGWAARHNL